MDRRKRTWLAVDVFYYRSRLAVGIRERFGVIGVVVFDAYLRACKTNSIEGEITYHSSEAFLSQIGLPGLDLRDEHGVPWELDALWTYLGRMKNVRRTRSGHLQNVRSTRWERWQNSRSKPRNAGPMPREYADDAQPDNDMTRHDLYKDNDSDSGITVVEDYESIPNSVWSSFARRMFERQPVGSVAHPMRWIQGCERRAREEHSIRAEHLMRNFDLSETQLVDLLVSGGSPGWLEGCRKRDVS